MSTILLVGYDELLLKTRSAVLRTTGAKTICTKPALALTMLADRQWDLVILCHSLPDAMISGLAETIHAHWPLTPILLVSSTRVWEPAAAVQTFNAVSSADPERLILRAAELLRSPASRNANTAQSAN